MGRMKVYVTGMGVLSCLGNRVDDVMGSLVAGKTGVVAMPEWKKYVGLHSHVGAPVVPFDEKVIPRNARRTMSKMAEMAVLASGQALQQADLKLADCDASRTLLLVGSTTGSPETMEMFFGRLAERGGPEGQLGTTFFKVMSHSVSSNVALALDFSGPVSSVSSACATSGQTIAMAWEMIRSGLYDVVLAGGADEMHYATASVFDIVGAATRAYGDRPHQASRPFDEARDGLAVSEGAAILVLESEAHAKKRGVAPLAELAAGAYWCDGKHMSQPQADSMTAVMQSALNRAGLSTRDIDYVSAHATGTRLGDAEEARATAALFGDGVPVSSLKGHFGHALAACGAIEGIVSIEMMRRKILLPTLNLDKIDPECAGIRHVTELTEATPRAVLSNNFAFGGMSTSLVILAR